MKIEAKLKIPMGFEHSRLPTCCITYGNRLIVDVDAALNHEAEVQVYLNDREVQFSGVNVTDDLVAPVDDLSSNVVGLVLFPSESIRLEPSSHPHECEYGLDFTDVITVARRPTEVVVSAGGYWLLSDRFSDVPFDEAETLRVHLAGTQQRIPFAAFRLTPTTTSLRPLITPLNMVCLGCDSSDLTFPTCFCQTGPQSADVAVDTLGLGPHESLHPIVFSIEGAREFSIACQRRVKFAKVYDDTSPHLRILELFLEQLYQSD